MGGLWRYALLLTLVAGMAQQAGAQNMFDQNSMLKQVNGQQYVINSPRMYFWNILPRTQPGYDSVIVQPYNWKGSPDSLTIQPNSTTLILNAQGRITKAYSTRNGKRTLAETISYNASGLPTVHLSYKNLATGETFGKDSLVLMYKELNNALVLEKTYLFKIRPGKGSVPFESYYYTYNDLGLYNKVYRINWQKDPEIYYLFPDEISEATIKEYLTQEQYIIEASYTYKPGSIIESRSDDLVSNRIYLANDSTMVTETTGRYGLEKTVVTYDAAGQLKRVMATSAAGVEKNAMRMQWEAGRVMQMTIYKRGNNPVGGVAKYTYYK